MEPLLDGWGRPIRSLRVSVTDRCNFRCRYCMPAEGLEWLERDEPLTFEEIERLQRGLAALGVEVMPYYGRRPVVRPGISGVRPLVARGPRLGELPPVTVTVLLHQL